MITKFNRQLRQLLPNFTDNFINYSIQPSIAVITYFTGNYSNYLILEVITQFYRQLGKLNSFYRFLETIMEINYFHRSLW